jgi:putative ABC transport system permease protein
MIKLALRGVLAHKVRLALTTLAIVLGVAFVAGTYVFTDSVKSSFDTLFTDVSSGVDFYVRGVSEFGNQSPRIPDSIVTRVREVPGVEVAAPTVDGSAQLVDQAGSPIGGNGPPTIGTSWSWDQEGLSAVRIREGEWPLGPGYVAIDAVSADGHGFHVGDPIDVILPAGVHRFEISGIATFGDAGNLMGATLAIFDVPTAQQIFDSEGEVSSISVVLSPGVSASAVEALVAGMLPDTAEIVSAQAQTDDWISQVDQGVGFVNTLLLVIAGIAVFVGAFLIQNTFRIIVAQRTRELALLRAVGATAGQVTRMVVVEAFVVGVVASVVGVGVGILIAQGLKAAFSAFGLGIPTSSLIVASRTIVVGLIVGVGVTLAAALIPARRAARVPPVAALRDIENPPRSLASRLIAGASVTGAGLVMLVVGLAANVSHAVALVGLGALIVFVGVSLLAPLVAREFARFAGAPVARLRGVTGRLAQENAMRRPRRTASTASALMIGVALVTVIAVFSASTKAGVASSLRETFANDFQVSVGGFGDPTTTGLSPTLTDELRQLPELQTVVRDRFGIFRFEGSDADSYLLGVDGPMSQVVNVRMVAGSVDDLGPGTAMLAKADADRLGLAVGDIVAVDVPNSAVLYLRVAGIFDDPAVGVPLVIDLHTYEHYQTQRLDRFIYIDVAPGVDLGTARAAIAAVTSRYPNARLTDTNELIADYEKQIGTILNLVVVLLGFAIVIALLGIVNTLALSITERRHELGLLRAVGMDRRQVRRMIRWEAVLIAVFGGVLGLIVGLVLGSAVVVAVGQGLRLSYPVAQLIVYLVAAAVGGVVAAILPARRAARLDILDSIAYE